MKILEALGLRRRQPDPLPSSITLGTLADLGCIWAMNGERFDCFEVWYDSADDLIHTRMCDQRSPSAIPRGISGSRAYSSDGLKPADGTERYANFAPTYLKKSWELPRRSVK
jgi:hypothetical protein